MKRFFIIVCLVGTLLCACGTDDDTKISAQQESGDGNSESITAAEADALPDGETASDLIGEFDTWREAYRYFFENYAKEFDQAYATAVLLYLDSDDIPELVINSAFEASGEEALSFYDGKLYRLHLRRTGSTFKEGEGLIRNDTGHMDYYPLNIYKLYHGQFYLLFEGLYGALDERPLSEVYADYENPAFNYEIAGKECTKEEFEAAAKKAFGDGTGTRPDKWFSIDEMKLLFSL